MTGRMARLPLSFHPDARLDALHAFEYYSDSCSTVADAFREELLLAGNRIPGITRTLAELYLGHEAIPDEEVSVCCCLSISGEAHRDYRRRTRPTETGVLEGQNLVGKDAAAETPKANEKRRACGSCF